MKHKLFAYLISIIVLAAAIMLSGCSRSSDEPEMEPPDDATLVEQLPTEPEETPEPDTGGNTGNSGAGTETPVPDAGTEGDEEDEDDEDSDTEGIEVIALTVDLQWRRTADGGTEILRAELVGMRYGSEVRLNPDASVVITDDIYGVRNFNLLGRDSANYSVIIPNLRESEQEPAPPTPEPTPTPTPDNIQNGENTPAPTPLPPRQEPPATEPAPSPTSISDFRQIYPAGTHMSISGNSVEYVQKIVSAVYPNWRANLRTWTGDDAIENMRRGNQVTFINGARGIILSVDDDNRTITTTEADINGRVVWDHNRSFDDIVSVTNYHD